MASLQLLCLNSFLFQKTLALESPARAAKLLPSLAFGSSHSHGTKDSLVQ